MVRSFCTVVGASEFSAASKVLSSAGVSRLVYSAVSSCCRPAAWSNTTRSAGVSDPDANAPASTASCSSISSRVLMVAISPRPSVAAAASVVLFASAWNTADCSMMILVYAPSASSGVSSSFFTAVRSPVMPLTEPIILVIAADSCGLVLDWVPDELMAMSSVSAPALVAMTADWYTLRLAASGCDR